jgi:hypothetical protein
MPLRDQCHDAPQMALINLFHGKPAEPQLAVLWNRQPGDQVGEGGFPYPARTRRARRIPSWTD